jgi:hypothetical protein
MKIRLTYLVQAVFAVLVAVGLSFGASRATATQTAASMASCPAEGYDYYYAPCAYSCPGGQGYCSYSGQCRCGHIP